MRYEMVRWSPGLCSCERLDEIVIQWDGEIVRWSPGLWSCVRAARTTVWLWTRGRGGCEKVEKVPCSVRMMIKSYFFKWQNGISIEILFLSNDKSTTHLGPQTPSLGLRQGRGRGPEHAIIIVICLVFVFVFAIIICNFHLYLYLQSKL